MMMKRLLTAIACFFALNMSAQALYNPDVDGDGCITVTDVLGVLSLFDTCEEGTTLFYFHDDPGKHPFGGYLNINNFETDLWWLTDENGEFYQSTDFAEFMEWTIEHQGMIISEHSVMEIDSVLNVSIPLAESIPNGSIDMPQSIAPGYYFIIVNQELDFPFASTPVFYGLGQTASPVITHEFQWQGETWSLLQLTDFTTTTSPFVINVTCGY
jgi:hypothetical protein